MREVLPHKADHPRDAKLECQFLERVLVPVVHASMMYGMIDGTTGPPPLSNAGIDTGLDSIAELLLSPIPRLMRFSRKTFGLDRDAAGV
jgi:hypothetical protein